MKKLNLGVRRRFVIMIGAALLLTTAAAASIWAVNLRAGSPSTADSVLGTSPAHVRPPATVQGSASKDADGAAQVVRFTLYDVGILPKQERVHKGLVAVVLEDSSGSSAGLVVERQNNGHAPERAGQVHRYEQSRRGKTELKLEPGVYAVFDGDNPRHRAELIVEQ